MGKSTEPPTCRFCGKQHRGTCMDHDARGAMSSQLNIPVQPEVARSNRASIAGTQAPPVDTTTRGTPRQRAPKGTFDRKAYQAQKARERRAKLKGKP